MPLHLGLGQSEDFADRLIDVQQVSARRDFLYERTNAADNLAGASAVPDDAAERLSDFVEIRLSRAKPTQARIGVGDYRGNRLVDFVRDRGRHLSQQHYPIETLEIGLGLLQSLLGTFAIGDVDDDCAADRLACCLSRERRTK